MKNIKSETWSNGFKFDDSIKQTNLTGFSEEIIDESYEAINRFYQKENKRGKAPPKKLKQAWQ